MKKLFAFVGLGFLAFNPSAFTQCSIGESEVYIDVTTDDYGYEVYWQLLPGGNACGTGTLFAGGNPLVGCLGGSLENQNPGGYGNNLTITEGPWCLTDGATYDIIFVDDWGDEGADFTISIAGFPMYTWTSGDGAGAGSLYSFVVEQPLAFDMEGEKINLPGYVNSGNVTISGMLHNIGATTITDMDINYRIDNGTVITAPLTGLNIAPFTDYTFSHPTTWNVSVNGTYFIEAWASNLNGNADLDNTNDTIQKTVEVGPGIPNLVDDYVSIIPAQTIIADGTNGIVVPRDLDFHPTLSRNELWVVLKSTEGNGGKTVKISNAGSGTQTELVQQDGNALHFMSLPTGIAFSSDNENFSTSPGVYDANHDGGQPFTGPTLWSSDPLIYAQPSGGNGSHLDMLHESPYSMGIAHEVDNAFWVNDGESNCVTRYDFKVDHGPGNSDHSDGVVRRYSGMGLAEEVTHHVVSGLVLDKNTNMLYIVDTGNDRIVRLDITTGTATGTFTPHEGVAEASVYSGYTATDYISTGLIEPSGIDIVEDRMIVSDHSNGDIVIYDISGATGIEVGRIQTGTPGIMGVKIGPDGKIWYANATTNEIVRLEYQDFTGIDETEESISVLVYPNPVANAILNINTTVIGIHSITIIDITGKSVLTYNANTSNSQVDVSTLAAGTYFVRVNDGVNGLSITKKITVAR